MNPIFLRLSCLSCIAMLAAAASSITCLAIDPNHCAHRSGTRGHAYCQERYPELPLCSRCDAAADGHDGCTDAERDPVCFVGVPAPSGSSGSEESSATGTDGASGTTNVDLCIPAECEAQDATRPSCTAVGDCVPCGEAGGDAACEAADPSRPACRVVDDDAGPAGSCAHCTEADTGACVGGAPICDVQTQTCMRCTEHSQCLQAWGSACHIESGECLPTQAVWHVDGDAVAVGDGTAEKPFGTIADAMMAMDTAGATRATIVLHGLDDEDDAYDESVAIDGARVLAIVAPEGERPVLDFGRSGGIVSISGAGTVAYLHGSTLRNGTVDAGVRVESSAHAHVDRCEIVDNHGGLAVDGARLVLRNSIVTTRVADTSAVVVTGTEATADIVYSTLAHTGTVPLGSSANALHCVGDSTSVRNSVVLSRSGGEPNGWDCPGGTSLHTVGENLPAGEGNYFICEAPGFDCMADEILMFFQNAADLRLSPQGTTTFSGIPKAEQGDPREDIDGNPRAEGHDFAGAHAPCPRCSSP